MRLILYFATPITFAYAFAFGFTAASPVTARKCVDDGI